MGFLGYKTITITLLCSLLGLALFYPYPRSRIATIQSRSSHITAQSVEMPLPLQMDLKFSSNTLSLEQQGWKMVSNLVAVPVTAEEKTNPNALYRIHHHDFFNSENSFQDQRGRLIVFNPDRDRFGVISGTLVISLNNQLEMNRFISDHSLRVDEYAESIHTIFVRTSTPSELSTLHASLTKDKRVKTLEVEVIENRMVKQ
jgi:hypothetical protein